MKTQQLACIQTSHLANMKLKNFQFPNSKSCQYAKLSNFQYDNSIYLSNMKTKQLVCIQTSHLPVSKL